MKNVLSLKNNYINVLEDDGVISFGGNQSWIGSADSDRKSKNNIICAFGCGLISAVDILSYLEKKEDTEKKDSEEQLSIAGYREKLSEFERTHFHVSYYFGIPGTRLARKMNRFFRKKKLPYRAKWGMSGKKLLPRLREMLENDIPATLSIGPGFFHKDRLPLYALKLDKNGDIESGNLKYSVKRNGSTKDHYVTVTGMIEDDDRLLLEISSWGRKFFIDYKEYTDYVKKCDNYIFSNILYIRFTTGDRLPTTGSDPVARSLSPVARSLSPVVGSLSPVAEKTGKDEKR